MINISANLSLICLCAALLAGSGCVSSNPGTATLAPPETTATPDGPTAPKDAGAPDNLNHGPQAGSCLCINVPASNECAPQAFFCNSAGKCVCDDAVALMAKPAAKAELRTNTTECACGAGTPSEPSADCSLEHWFCNRGGHCRCDL
jgi:hypothetical protein